MTERAIPAPAIAAAIDLAQLFERDRELVLALNAAQGPPARVPPIA